jgi:transmembrane sensor
MNEPDHLLPDANTIAGENAVHWAHTRGAAARIVEHARAHRRRQQRVRQAWAGGVAALLLISGINFWLQQPAATLPPPATRPTLIVSLPPRQVLPDGSVIELKGEAKIVVDYSATTRRVQLVQGEAHFAVAPNPELPFIVSAGGVDVRAVGTEFVVGLTSASVDVLVTEGRVAVENHATVEPRLAWLDAGQAVVVERTAFVSTLHPSLSTEEQNSRLAWRVPRFELSSTPLAEVVECFNRHGVVRFELADPTIGALQLSGVLRPDSPHALLHILRTDFDLRDQRRADGTIVLNKR